MVDMHAALLIFATLLASVNSQATRDVISLTSDRSAALLIVATLLASANSQATGVCPSTAEIANCNDCWDPDTECIECLEGWWWKDLNTCLACSDHCGLCTDGNSDDITECLECHEGYYKTDDQNCYWCNGHCSSCTGDWECATCAEHYREEADDQISCLECATGCEHCLDAATYSCYDCLDGYYLVMTNEDSGTCIACGSFCLECTSGTTCDLCTTGYTWTGTACVACIDYCDPDQCATNGACSGCVEGYFLSADSQQCRSCDHCADCPATIECTTCDNGYIRNDDGTCHSCPDIDNNVNCRRCGSDDRGRFMNTDSECDYCADNCLTCTAADVCVECAHGYYLSGTSCLACDDSCVTCSGGLSSNCLACTESEGRVGGACTDCPSGTSSPNCATCSGSNCQTCEDNYFVHPTPTDDGNFCRLCSASDSNESQETCVDCAPSSRGRYLSTDRCVGCDTYGSACETCTSSACTSCADTWYIDGSGDCARCDDSTNCLTCTSDAVGACTACRTGYWESNGACLDCVAGCDDCVDSSTCSVCSAAHWQEYEVLCLACVVSNCRNCIADVTQCTACEDGYYLTSATQCEACAVSNCATCTTDAATCATCEPGRKLDSNTCTAECFDNCIDCDSADDTRVAANIDNFDVTCDACADEMTVVNTMLCYNCDDSNCLECSDASTCTSCPVGMYVDTSDECSPCTAPCSECMTTATTCTACTGTLFENSNACHDCTMVHAQCTECTGQTTGSCTACASGYFQYGGSCLNCAVVHLGCTECDGETVGIDCTACAADHYLTLGGSCEACDGNCATCETSAAMCLTCPSANMFVAGDSTCTACDANCATCETTAVKCLTCPSANMFVASDFTCTACDANCATCETTAVKCLTCPSANMFVASDFTCTACNVVCATCAPDAATCTACASGEYLHPSDNTCYTCNHAECIACDSNGATDCTACDVGFFVNATGSCGACTGDCTACDTSATDCTACSGGKFAHTDGMCYDCSLVHDECVQCSGETAVDCLVCADGWFQRNGMCKECTFAECSDCNTNGCSTCNAGFFLHDTDTCEACPDNCLRCSFPQTCDNCNDGFFVDNGQCSGCSSDCTTCSDDSTCSDCDAGFFLTIANVCEACSAHCTECSSSLVCTDCDPGYVIVNDECSACPSDCDDCSATLNNCGTCNSGFSPVEICASCNDDNCIACTNADTCTACDTGFYLEAVGNTCESCPGNCDICTSGTACTVCSSGFENTGTTCSAIASSLVQNCVTDNGSGVCTECASTYFLDPFSDLCVSCSDVDPNDASYSCEACAGSGSGSHDNVQAWLATCENCPSNCIECSSDTQCSTCVDGMYTDETECFPLVCTVLSAITHRTACEACSETNFNKDGGEYRGLFWTGSECKECVRNCEACSSDSFCDDCRDHHLWDAAEGLCVDCDFAEDYECTGCVSGVRGRYVESDQRCYLCDEECIHCEGDASTCTECSSTTFLLDSSCVSCLDGSITAEGCAECQGKYSAWASNVHAWMLGAQADPTVDAVMGCNECPTNCAACSELNTCTTCAGVRYFFSEAATSTYECRDCMTNCADCSDGTSCNACYTGYYYVQTVTTNSCTACPANCADCSHDDGCTACHTGYYLTADNTCLSCSTAVPNCVACLLSGEAVTCTACSATFYPTELNSIAGGQCTSCDVNCLLCDRNEDCLQCQPDHCYDSTEKVCRANAGRNCDECELRNEAVSCLTCNEHFFLDLCQPCDDAQCLSCPNAADECEECIDTYYLTDAKDCSICPSGCVLCNDGISCNECRYGTFWNSESLVCTSCTALCGECNNLDKCDECAYENMYKDTVEGVTTCHVCFDNCEECDDEVECLTCYDGYRGVLDVNGIATTCISCPTGCEDCALADDGITVTCSGCFDGYIHTSTGVCEACSTFGNCIECYDYNVNDVVDAGDCVECAPGYILNDVGDACLSCTITGCEECQDRNFVCEECSGDLEPTLDQYDCGGSCYFCADSEECSEAPVLNGTAIMDGSAYSTVGCVDGCFVTRNETADGIFYYRGCSELVCDSYLSEFCNEYGEGAEAVTECSQCCRDGLCNTQTLTGATAGATQLVVSVMLLLTAMLMVKLF